MWAGKGLPAAAGAKFPTKLLSPRTEERRLHLFEKGPPFLLCSLKKCTVLLPQHPTPYHRQALEILPAFSSNTEKDLDRVRLAFFTKNLRNQMG